MLLPQYQRSIAILLAIAMTAVFILIVPAVCQGFPTPAVSQVKLSGISPGQSGSHNFYVNAKMVNEGTGGYIIIRTKLVNLSRNSIEGTTTNTLYMTAGEERNITTIVKGPGDYPGMIVMEAERKTAFNYGQ